MASVGENRERAVVRHRRSGRNFRKMEKIFRNESVAITGGGGGKRLRTPAPPRPAPGRQQASNTRVDPGPASIV